MSTMSYASYRGCGIDVCVTPARVHAVGGIYRRFRVSWTVTLPTDPDRRLTSLPEKFDFLTEKDAFRYGEKRAHTFIDSVLSTPSQKRMLDEENKVSI